MRLSLLRGVLILLFMAAMVRDTPAPLVYRPGEGWSYEPVGGGAWRKTRAKDQLEVAQSAFEAKSYRMSVKAGKRVVKTWPLSDYAPEAQYLVGRSYEERKMDEKAFKAYQLLIERYPKTEMYQEVLKRQYVIANRFLAGQWFRLWGILPLYPSMDKTVDMYEKLVKNGPYSEVAPDAQMNIGAAREKQSDFRAAVKAYETAADRYWDRAKVASDALFKAATSYNLQARKADYDQSVAGRAIASYTDFMTLYPDDPRVNEARDIIASLKTEQSRGALSVAEFYVKKRKWDAALIYYNEVVLKDPNSPFADLARKQIDAIKKKTATQNAAK